MAVMYKNTSEGPKPVMGAKWLTQELLWGLVLGAPVGIILALYF